MFKRLSIFVRKFEIKLCVNNEVCLIFALKPVSKIIVKYVLNSVKTVLLK